MIKAAFPSSANGFYYVNNPVNLSDTSSSAHLFGEQGPDGASVLKVFCNFASEDLRTTCLATQCTTQCRQFTRSEGEELVSELVAVR